MKILMSQCVLYDLCTVQLSPENTEEYIDYLRSVGRLDEAAVRLAAVVNDESFVSKEGKSNYQVRFYSHPKHLTMCQFFKLSRIIDKTCFYVYFSDSCGMSYVT